MDTQSGQPGPQQASSGQAESFWGKQSSRLDDWLAIQPDGTITAKSGKVELGTGVRTALAQIVAEELDVAVESVRVIMGDTALTPDEGYTAGSMTIQSSGTALRHAAAEARRALLDLASERLDAVLGELAVRDGIIMVVGRPDRTTTYGELMGGKLFNREVTGNAPLKRPETYRVVGTSTPRVDLPPKFTGQPSFVQDVRVPGMLHARVVRPPGVGARLVSVDESSVQDVPGLVKVVQQGNYVAVIAEREEQAILAAQRLRVKWDESAMLPPMQDLYSWLRAQPTKDDVLAESGDVETALTQAVRQVQATYFQPYHAHASIGPACAVADVTAEGVTVWASTQGPYPLRGALAQLLEVPAETVHLTHVEGAGCYGQNGADDVAGDAVILSRAVGRPVRVQWSREEEFAWEPKAPAMVMEVRGGLDAQGNVVAWDYNVWSPTHAARPRFAGQLLVAQLLAGQTPLPARFFLGGERNAPTNYAIGNQRVTIHWLSNSPLRASSFRSLGGAANTFANESFIDELAAAAGVDAVEFRLLHLTDPRARDVITVAAEKTVSGAVHVQRIVIAHDCGLIINPDGLRNQIEGNVIQSLSRALKEEVIFDQSRITSIDWETYPILTFSEMPEVEIVWINHPDLPAVGAGEPSTVTTAGAVANAIFDATGARIRQIPFTPRRVKAALG